MNIPKTLAEFKKLPSGTRLILVDNQVHTGLGKRVVHGLVDKGATMTFRCPDGAISFLAFTKTGEYFFTVTTFGFKEAGKIAAEYKFDEEAAP